jgi:uncharacterized protein (DUF488 family)
LLLQDTMMEKKYIWTIGHSTHPIEKFIAMLKSFDIQLLADIRSLPGSKRYPHFNSDELSAILTENKIGYIHLKELGGRRKPRTDSQNTAWRVDAFRGYADYMETDEFRKTVTQLQALAMKQRVAYMCAEAVWWRCHRSLVSDYFKHAGWTVMHIMDAGKAEEHPYTAPATIEGHKLVYRKKSEPGLFP